MDEIAAVLARIDAKLDTLLETSRDHEKRIRWTERAIWLALGAGLASGGVIGGGVVSIISK